MTKYLCTVCGYMYNEKENSFSSLPDKWMCPICGASKSLFIPTETKSEPKSQPKEKKTDLTVLQKSVICSNLAKGCEKQFKSDEAKLFRELSASFKAQMAKPEDPTFSALHELVNSDIDERFPLAKTAATNAADRGALRALVWSEKVSKIHSSLLSRYAEEGDAMLENTNIFVCPICGFIATGDNTPQKCPVCSVPEWMFETVEG